MAMAAALAPCHVAPRSSPLLGLSLRPATCHAARLPRGAPRLATVSAVASAPASAATGDDSQPARDTWRQRAAAAALAASLSLGTLGFSSLPAVAAESNVLASPPPGESHLVDDAGVLNRVTKSDLRRLLGELEEKTGFHIDFVTLRKITSKGDVFGFADQVIEKWYPTIEEGDKKGVVVLVTTAKEAAITGGPSFNKAVGDSLLEALIAENLPVLATSEKYNEAIYSSAKRLVTQLEEGKDVGGPKFEETKRVSNFKTKGETEEKRGQFQFVVGGLLVIAFVVPMAQYYAYVSKK